MLVLYILAVKESRLSAKNLHPWEIKTTRFEGEHFFVIIYTCTPSQANGFWNTIHGSLFTIE
jgi:hypothetical protein